MSQRRRIGSGWLLLIIVALVVGAVLIAPAENDAGGTYSTLSAGRQGTRILFELSKRLGWAPERRDVVFTADSAPAPVQVLIAVSPGAEETHALLNFIRAGGSLLLVGVDGEIGDSLFVTSWRRGFPVAQHPNACVADPFESLIEGSRPIESLRWRRPAPLDTVGFGVLTRVEGLADAQLRPAVAMPVGRGRVALVADPNFLVNDLVRSCSTEADVAFVGMMQYLTAGRPGVRIAFDEFHHGSGVHGGSLSAIRLYMITTSSGRMLGQVALAGLLLLLAAAPRPLAPRDPLRVARRSPLEHADALAHAYLAVRATKTATARLLAGVRRRVRRGRAGRDTDEQLLSTAVAQAPDIAADAQLVSGALASQLPERDLPKVAAALARIERALLTRPAPRKT